MLRSLHTRTPLFGVNRGIAGVWESDGRNHSLRTAFRGAGIRDVITNPNVWHTANLRGSDEFVIYVSS